MSDALVGFYREHEARRCGLHPVLQCGGRGQAPEGVIDLHAVQALGIVVEELFGRKLGRVEARLPGRICEAGRASIQSCHGISLSLSGGLYAAAAPDSGLVCERAGAVDCRAHRSGHRSPQLWDRPGGGSHDRHRRLHDWLAGAGCGSAAFRSDLRTFSTGGECLPAESGVAVHAGLQSARDPECRIGIIAADHSYRLAALPGVLVLTPENPADLAQALGDAAAHGRTIACGGNSSKRLMAGPSEPADVAISTTALPRVLEYEPHDLTISVEAGLPWRSITRLLAVNRQMVPLDPPFADSATRSEEHTSEIHSLR